MPTTVEMYTSPEKVRRLLRLSSAFSSTSNPTDEQVLDLIERKMYEIDTETKSSFHLSQSKEYHDVRDPFQPDAGVRVYLSHKNIVVPLSGAVGDSLKLFDGSNWIEFVGSKTEGRANDFWIDEQFGLLHIRNGVYYESHLAVDVTYRYNNGARTTVSGAITSTDTTLLVPSTQGFPMQGSITISGEQIRYNNKTATSFTLVERGAYNSTADAQQNATPVFWVPKDIEDICTKLVAIELLTAEDWSSGGLTSGDIPSGQASINSKIESWKKDIENTYNRYRPVFTAVR